MRIYSSIEPHIRFLLFFNEVFANCDGYVPIKNSFPAVYVYILRIGLIKSNICVDMDVRETAK